MVNIYISIIVPMYNAELTINRCLSSIMDTQFVSYEIIVVDDGSTDGSKKIVEQLMKKNFHIKLISQKNAGPSVARNRGIEEAKGKVIAFVDSDDYVNHGYLECLWNKFEESKADVVFFAYNMMDSNGEIIERCDLPELQTDYYRNLFELSKKDMFGYTWGKAFKKELIGTTRFYTDINLHEDEIFACEVLCKAEKLVYLNEPLYCYVKTHDSLMNRTHQDYSRICNLVWNKWKILLIDNAEGTEMLAVRANQIATNCKWYVLDKNVNKIMFYRDMINSDFIKAVTVKDPLIHAIRKKNWCSIFLYHFYYKAKTFVINLVR